MGFLKRFLCLFIVVAILGSTAVFAVPEKEAVDHVSYSIGDGQVTVTGYLGTAVSVTVPATIEGLPVTKIGTNAFRNCEQLTDITLPGSITAIGDRAFEGCTGLKTVNFLGSEAQWSQLSIGNFNTPLLDTAIIFHQRAGDFTGDGLVTNDDVVFLLWYTLFPEEYPITINGDFNSDNDINNDDVVYLLWHTLYPAEYPLQPDDSGDAQQILARRRDTVEAAMRHMMGVLWTPTEDITFSIKNASNGVARDQETNPDDVMTMYAGNIYQGIPYTHGSGSGYSWLDFATDVDADHVYTLDGMTTPLLNGSSKYRVNRVARLGNDCADAVFWAWSQVSSSITFTGTNYMTQSHGCLKVGDYDFEGDRYFVSAEESISTKKICQNNGTQRMFAAYAQLQKGDGLVMITASGAGHAIMNVSVHVEYTDDGLIDGENSYAVILEQTSSNERAGNSYYNEDIGKTVYLCEELDKHWSFNTLLNKGYLPVTCKELVDPSPLQTPAIVDSLADLTPDTMFTGRIDANYRISSVTATIYDADGMPVQESTCFGTQTEMFYFDLSRFTDSLEQDVLLGKLDLDALVSGSYRCTFSARLGTGDVIIFRDFTFTK